MKETRNISHHTFPEYPFKTIVMVISEANEALQRIDTLMKPNYTLRLLTNYDTSNKETAIETLEKRPDEIFLPSDQKVEVTLEFPTVQ